MGKASKAAKAKPSPKADPKGAKKEEPKKAKPPPATQAAAAEPAAAAPPAPGGGAAAARAADGVEAKPPPAPQAAAAEPPAAAPPAPEGGAAAAGAADGVEAAEVAASADSDTKTQQPEERTVKAARSNFDEQLAKTVDILEALQRRLDGQSQTMLAEHKQLEERLRGAEDEARLAAKAAEERRGKLHALALDCEKLQEQLEAAKKSANAGCSREALKGKTKTEQQATAKVGKGNAEVASDKESERGAQDEEFAEAEDDLQQAEAEEAEGEDEKSIEEDEKAECEKEQVADLGNADPENKKWFGGWFKKKQTHASGQAGS